jgi:hypothetical protein
MRKNRSGLENNRLTGKDFVVAHKKSACRPPVMPDVIRHPEMNRVENALDSGSGPE